jgi:hypothetical protein
MTEHTTTVSQCITILPTSNQFTSGLGKLTMEVTIHENQTPTAYILTPESLQQASNTQNSIEPPIS